MKTSVEISIAYSKSVKKNVFKRTGNQWKKKRKKISRKENHLVLLLGRSFFPFNYYSNSRLSVKHKLELLHAKEPIPVSWS